MTKKEKCISNKTIAYYSGVGGLEVRAIEYGAEDYMYCIANAWHGKPTFHKLKINYGKNGGDYIRLHGYKMPLADFIRV